MNTFAISTPRLPTIAISPGLRPFVRRAAEDVAGDIGKIFGARLAIVEGAAPASNAIVLRKEGEGWENYAVESKPGNVLEITGSDDHGVMFGLYRFASECLGVDPFYHWSGREPAKAAERTWESISIHQGDPSFRFRGWFINDEDFINGFRPEENGKREIDYPLYHVCFGPSMAEEIYETAVRAGFNMMVCASYVDILNDGILCSNIAGMAKALFQPSRHELPIAVSPYCEEPDRLTDIAADLLKRVNQDMFPVFRDPARLALRARTQAAGFARCLEQLERASRAMDEARRRQLFERFGYPAEFLRLTSDIYAELFAAVEAKDADDGPCALRHAKAAIALAPRTRRARRALQLGQVDALVRPRPQIPVSFRDGRS